MIIIGIDPDSNKSGVAVYENCILTDLKSMSLVDIFENLSLYYRFYECELHIEDVNGISSNAFSYNKKDPIPVKLKKAEHVGKCKQTQIEIERIAEHFNIKVVRHAVSKQWKDQPGKKEFERVTGWTRRSNEDTRSAAYFGILGVMAHAKK